MDTSTTGQLPADTQQPGETGQQVMAKQQGGGQQQQQAQVRAPSPPPPPPSPPPPSPPPPPPSWETLLQLAHPRSSRPFKELIRRWAGT